MKAVILAAGVGKRLGGGNDLPKALLEFGGKSLLRRHVELLRACGIAEITIVVGHRADAIAAEISGLAEKREITLCPNPRYREGSIVSLWSACGALRAGAPVLVMDADVIYDIRLMQRLLSAGKGNCFLLDRDLEPGDEPQKLCIRGGEIVDLHKKPQAPHDWHGESIGFTLLSQDKAAELADILDGYVARNRTNVEHEEALRDLIIASPGTFGFVDITGLPWVEIDFPEDVARARDVILPQLVDA